MLKNIEQEEQENKRQIDVYPVKKGKRVLLYLCDLIITFFFAFVFYSLAVVPISEAAMNINQRQQESATARNERYIVLRENNILYSQYETQEIDGQVAYTAEQYARYYSDSITEVSIPDIFENYYLIIRFDQEGYNEKYIDDVEKHNSGFFTVDHETGILTLKDKYKSEFYEGFLPGSKLVGEGKKDYDDFVNKYFLPMYGEVLSDIQKLDLVSTTTYRSYMTCQRIVDGYELLFKNTVVVDSSISLFLGLCVSYLLIPLVNKKRRTASMIFMKIEKVNKNNFELKNKKSVFISFIYQLATNLWLIALVPLASVGFSFLFDLPALFPLAVASLIIVLVSLIILLVDEFNRPLIDRFSNTICITSDTLDDIYHARGYDL